MFCSINLDRTPLCFHRPTHPTETTLGVLLYFKSSMTLLGERASPLPATFKTLGDSFLLETKESIVFEKKKLKRTNHMSLPAHPAKRVWLLSFLVINSKMERITQKVEE